MELKSESFPTITKFIECTNNMGRASNMKKRARQFRAEHNLTKKEWREMRQEGRSDGANYGTTPVVKYRWTKKKYPKEEEVKEET